MVSVTLSIPEEIKKKMENFDEVNWSGLIRKTIIEKTKELEWKQNMLKRLKAGEEISEWALELQKKARKDRYNTLKKKGLI
ncbi:MAG: hypothetical protein Q8R18_04160 [bacterium]|nr:hypothetical protein [bacterium]